tara:strand:- start:588 stop:905 length:318 start_codon:yes stop_codon:yes gene_type:complete
MRILTILANRCHSKAILTRSDLDWLQEDTTVMFSVYDEICDCHKKGLKLFGAAQPELIEGAWMSMSRRWRVLFLSYLISPSWSPHLFVMISPSLPHHLPFYFSRP